MAKRMERKSLNTPDEIRRFEKGKLELAKLESGAVGRATFEPGWKWSTCVKPIAKTDSCQTAHFGYIVSGRMKVVMNDGTAEEYGPGDAMNIPPGHDAWIVGNEACVVIDVTGAEHYAERK
ncbi:MAG: cupin domain-containing protein [Deltaproteobacteria bacterium]|nr:cupin domain-containing protein [Deltaproteobacteria bacterium]